VTAVFAELQPGQFVFVYGDGFGLVTRLEGWALSAVEMAFGDGAGATYERRVAVFRDAGGSLDVAGATIVVPLAAADQSWHLVQDDGRIVAGGPRRGKGSLSAAELKEQRDSGRYEWLAGSRPVLGVPATARRSPTVDDPRPRPPATGTFTGARGGQYVWCGVPQTQPAAPHALVGANAFAHDTAVPAAPKQAA
jgi:hypothetical protein